MIYEKRQASDENMKKYDSKIDKYDSKLDNNAAIIKKMMVNNQICNFSPYSMYSTKDQSPNTMVTYNKKALPLEGGHSTKNGYMWTLRHEIISPKFYELKNFYNNINMCLFMCLNMVTRL